MRVRVMLTSPAWLTMRSSSGARTRTADCTAVVTARSVPCGGVAAVPKRDQSISAASRLSGAGAAAGSSRPVGLGRRRLGRHRRSLGGRRRRQFIRRRLERQRPGLRSPCAAPPRPTAPAYAGASRERSASKTAISASPRACSASTSAACAGACAEQTLDPRLEPVAHLAQPHRAGQARPALERVQRAHRRRRRGEVGRPVHPLAQAGRQLRQQLVGLLPRRSGTARRRPRRSLRSPRRRHLRRSSRASVARLTA